MTKTDMDGVAIGLGGDAVTLMPSGADGLAPVLFMAEIGGTLRLAVDARGVAPVFGREPGFFGVGQKQYC
ncbi:hypothetical protein [Methylovulum psychrotolerans]|nr:hypothetical protein [Methylovulum psychrotolerans]